MLLLFLFSIGCRYKLVVQTSPIGADVILNEKSLGPAPIEKLFWSSPFTQASLQIQKEGYRSIQTTVNLERRSVLRWIRPENEFKFILIKNHGPVGTWTSEDALSP